MTLNIFSDFRKPGLSRSKNINPVMEKIKLYIMSNRMRCLHMQSVTMPYHFIHNIYISSPL